MKKTNCTEFFVTTIKIIAKFALAVTTFSFTMKSEYVIVVKFDI